MNNIAFYIAAPDYTEYSSGRKVLHLIADQINHMGIEAYVTANITSDKLWTPKLNQDILDRHTRNKYLQIAIYPEIEMGNPLLAPNVVRWLLNKPNFFIKNWWGQFPSDEYVVHHKEEFKPKWINSKEQHVDHIDREIFNTKNINMAREGYVKYSSRVNIQEQYPEFVEKKYEINIKEVKKPEECAEIYKKTKGLIIYERAAATAEAALCGCFSIYRKNEKLGDTEWIDKSYWKLMSGFSFEQKSDIELINTAKVLEKIYDNEDLINKNKMVKTVEEIVKYFEHKDNKSEYVRSINIIKFKNYIVKNDLEEAKNILENKIKKINEEDLEYKYLKSRIYYKYNSIEEYKKEMTSILRIIDSGKYENYLHDIRGFMLKEMEALKII